ncbi:MAG: hypothetical protein ACI9WC_003241 [Arenicella sp.]|jgi:hypothetical protein
MALLTQVILRTDEWRGTFKTINRGVGRRSPLSPLFAAVYLKPLDDAMDQVRLSYVRYVDDWVVLSKTRWQLRRAVALVNRTLASILGRMAPIIRSRLAHQGKTRPVITVAHNTPRDWCIKVGQLKNIIDLLRANNTLISGSEKFTRNKPNLEIAKWFLAAPNDQRLPFFIQDITDAAIRIPSGDATNHSNGCIGISRLLLNEKVYSSIKGKIAALNHQTCMSEDCASEKDVQLVDYLDGHIAIALVGFESKHKVLHMKHKQRPLLG